MRPSGWQRWLNNEIMPTISDICRQVQAHLEARHEVSPSEGRELVEAFLEGGGVGGGKGRQVFGFGEFPPENLPALWAAVGRRAAGEPLAHVLGFAWFYGRRWKVTKDVLIPRFDTEILVEAVLAKLQTGWQVVEVGIGSGCVMGTLLAERADISVLGIDISDAAADVARENVAELGVEGRYKVVVNDGLEGIDKSFNLIVSNPPYVTDVEWENLENEVKDFEPRLALTGGEPNADGLVFYRRLAQWGLEKVQQGGWLCVETGWQQAQAVRKLLQEQLGPEGKSVWHEISVYKDLGGRERVVCARRC